MVEEDVSEDDVMNNSISVDWMLSSSCCFEAVPAAKDRAEKMIDVLVLAMED